MFLEVQIILKRFLLKVSINKLAMDVLKTSINIKLVLIDTVL